MALPPGPTGLPFVFLLRWMRNPFPVMDQLRAKYGEVFTVKLPAMPPLVMLSNPEHIREVFADPGDDMHAGKVATALEPFLGSRSVILLDGMEHKLMRKLVMPPFHGERMAAYGTAIHEITAESVKAWPRGVTFSVHKQMQSITLEIILRTVFGFDDGGKREAMRGMLTELLDLASWPPLLLPWMQRDLGAWSPWGRYRRSADAAYALLSEQVADRRRAGTAGKTDILSLLLEARDEEGRELSDDDLRAQLVTLLVAGHETTATALSWAFHWLLREERVMTKLRAELDGATVNGAFAPEKIAKLEYLDGVVRETLRMQPVIPIVGRVLQKPMRVAGWDLPAGVAVAPSIWLAHFRPENFPDPWTFDPERYIGKKHGPAEWMPFGGGVRRCIGMAFALYEMKLALATVLTRVDLMAAPGVKVVPERRSITIAPSKGVPVIATDRVKRSATEGATAVTG